ncbi:MAG: methyl-accepting chemotaxis protein [Myxococcaceae bacterium]|jgi:methyl-accepting chemotaxis protein|nr:methyl-accepting chemotaxis protein [Myxococcaceae bacterium]MCA3012608.1 methyl-accepting chemotaxis protein [Myxococcaceae bacterium]
MGALWARLSLRVQAGIAVAVPCMLIALFAAITFPSRLTQQAAEALERQATLLGQLAATNSAPTVRLINDGLAQPDELESLFKGLHASKELSRAGVLRLDPSRVKGTGRDRVITPTPGDGALVYGDLLPETYAVAPEDQCVTRRAETLDVCCTARDKDTAVMVVLRFSLDRFAEQRRDNQVLGLWLLVAGLALGLLLALLLSSAISRPLGVVTRLARELAAGDVTVSTVEVGGAEEVRSMAASVNEMVGSLKGLVGEMVSLSGRLSNAARGLIAASTDQEHVTSQQSAYAQQIAATFEELSRTAEMITRATETVEQAAGRTNQAVDDARSTVAKVVTAMTEIRRESKEVADVISRLNGELQQVSRIAAVIKQVADRSDLLALNAALEGTKAGEVGRGFSVVAAEMRKLAESVAQSARDIGRIVESVQQSGETAVSRSKQGVETSERGTQIAQQASTSFQQIVELARGTKEAAQQIAVATRQQRQSSEQAVAGARNVADLVKQGVDATGRTTRIAQDLQTSVEALTAVTGRFKVDPTGS